MYDELKVKYEKQLDFNNKLSKENNELKTTLQSIGILLQNNTQNPITDQNVSNNNFFCDSIEYINFGLFKTTIMKLIVKQDKFRLLFVKAKINNAHYHIGVPFTECQEVKYCNHPFLRIIMIKPTKSSAQRIHKILGLDDIFEQLFNVDSKCLLI